MKRPLLILVPQPKSQHMSFTWCRADEIVIPLAAMKETQIVDEPDIASHHWDRELQFRSREVNGIDRFSLSLREPWNPGTSPKPWVASQ